MRILRGRRGKLGEYVSFEDFLDVLLAPVNVNYEPGFPRFLLVNGGRCRRSAASQLRPRFGITHVGSAHHAGAYGSTRTRENRWIECFRRSRRGPERASVQGVAQR